MTLEVQGTAMPLIKAPNFSDKTWDTPMEKIRLLVGNEHGETLRSVTLTEFLQNLGDYLHDASAWPGRSKKSCNLYARDKDSHVLMSAQACFLPVPEAGGEVSFNVAAYQYQSRPRAPAVLCIISGMLGTSVCLITNDTGGGGGRRYQRLYFNKNGMACPFTGQLLREWRVKKGQTTNLDAPMTEEERLHNALLFIQVPLKAEKVSAEWSQGFSFGGGAPPASSGFSFGGGADGVYKGSGESAGIIYEGAFVPKGIYDGMTDAEMDAALLAADGPELFVPAPKKASTTKDAIVSIGESVGEYKELKGVGAKLKRDARYPVRVTVQFYKTTSNGGVSAEDLAIIASQFDEVRTKTQGTPKPATSLVMGGGDTGRPTEPGKVGWPAWWVAYYGTSTDQARARPPFSPSVPWALLTLEHRPFSAHWATIIRAWVRACSRAGASTAGATRTTYRHSSATFACSGSPRKRPRAGGCSSAQVWRGSSCIS